MRHAREIHAREIHAREMHAPKVHAYETRINGGAVVELRTCVRGARLYLRVFLACRTWVARVLVSTPRMV